MDLKIRNGFRLKTNNLKEFKEIINFEIRVILMNTLSKELYKECFQNFYLTNFKVKNIIQKQYRNTLEGLPNVIKNGVIDFSIIDVLCKIIYLKKDNVIYGLFDCDISNARNHFFNHSLVEHYSPNYYKDELDAKIKKEIWNSLCYSLVNKDNYFLEEDWVFIDYPRLQDVILRIKNTCLNDILLERELLNEYILDKYCLENQIKNYVEISSVLRTIKDIDSIDELSKNYAKYIMDFNNIYCIYKNAYNYF